MKRRSKENKRCTKLCDHTVIWFIFIVLAFGVTAASAQESSGQFPGGSVKIGYDSRSCSGSIEGALRYHSANTCVELCNGSSWVCTGTGGCFAPGDCSTIGATCADGSKFAGFVVYGASCAPLYSAAADYNSSSTVAWSSVSVDGGADSLTDGQVNQAWVVANTTLSQYPAFEACENLTDHGKGDWYLPARGEMNLLRANKTAIGGFANNNYWTSTEADTTRGVAQHTGNYSQAQTTKTTTYRVRCVRRN